MQELREPAANPSRPLRIADLEQRVLDVAAENLGLHVRGQFELLLEELKLRDGLLGGEEIGAEANAVLPPDQEFAAKAEKRQKGSA